MAICRISLLRTSHLSSTRSNFHQALPATSGDNNEVVVQQAFRLDLFSKLRKRRA
jgi:hypothetical protein